MPVENVGQPVVLRTNKEARKALVKSKDGRVKWLTVSADPSEPSWEECVRSWARKLGVCAQPSPSTPDTPLPTPPPDGKHWLCRETGDNPTTAAPDVEVDVDVQQTTVEQKLSRKEAAQSKRTGSSTFARGFLLGLGGVGSNNNNSSSSSAGKVEGCVGDAIAAPHSTLPGVRTMMEEGSTCGRDRWVKGFKGAPSSPTNSSTDGDTSIDTSKSSSDASLPKSDSQSTEAWLETIHSSAVNTSNSNSLLDSSMPSKAKKKKNKGGKAKGKCGKSRANKSSVSKGNMIRVDASTSGSTKQGKDKSTLNVTFGNVTLLEFTRDVGGCTVPSDGTWALSLGLPFRETMLDVNDYEASKAEILLERALKLSKKQRNLATGETRQFDHRPVGERNPLFGRLDEKERSKRLLDYACFHKSDHEEAYRDNHHEDLGGPLYKVSHSDFVDKSQEAAAELVALRKSRRSSQGCSCVCFRADKLNVAKLRGELSKRGLKASGSKKDLTKMLQDAMRQENEDHGGEGHRVCRSDDCQCVRDGVECHADLCNCCKGPNIGKKDAHHGGNCGNPMGVYAYNSSIVRAYRDPYVTAKSVPVQERWHVRSNSIGSEHH